MPSHLPHPSVYVALVTPFTSQGAVDLAALKSLVRAHAHASGLGFLIGGTTGEAMSLSLDETVQLVRATREGLGTDERGLIVGFRVATAADVAEVTARAKDAGADSLLLGPVIGSTPEDAEAFLRSAAPSSRLPVYLYENPTIGQPSLGLDRIQRLLSLANVVGVKDSSGDEGQARALGPSVLVGSPKLLERLGSSVGGAVVGLANLYPRTASLLHATDFAESVPAWEAGIAFASRFGVRGLKAALAVAGWCSTVVRPPHGAVDDEVRRAAEILVREHPLELHGC